jgi:hypothetical protein
LFSCGLLFAKLVLKFTIPGEGSLFEDALKNIAAS